jgi:hypothetical protein
MIPQRRRIVGSARMGTGAVMSRNLPPATRDMLLEEADRGSIPAGIEILKEVYLGDTRGADPVGARIANDPEAMDFFADYWEFVHWDCRGNEPTLSEVMFEGLIDMLMRPEHE